MYAKPAIRQTYIHKDERGTSVRLFQAQDLSLLNLHETYFLSVHNYLSGSLRGMHSQGDPHSENKLVTVTKGKIFDVCIDIREDSPYFQTAYCCTLSSNEPSILYIPRGFIHGYQTLEPDTSMLYAIDTIYDPDFSISFNPLSPAIQGLWPLSVIRLSTKDRDSLNLPFENVKIELLVSE
jgi:dTDP-4-dehydrorhamnose 3,5-epimerase